MKSQSGQAAIEYVLLLVISVALVLMLMTQFFKPMQDFIASYMGDYTACLLETGELPSLGGDSTVAADEGCNAKFAPASLAGGRPANGTTGGKSSSNSENSSNSSATGVSPSGAAGASSSNLSGRNYGRIGNGMSGADGNGKNEKVVEIALDNGGSGSFFRSSSVSYVRRASPKSMSIATSSMPEYEKKKLDKKESNPVRVISSDGTGAKPKKLALKVPEKKQILADEEQPFTIGNFMRIIFIIGIILAIVIFVGGQALQMSKSMD